MFKPERFDALRRGTCKGNARSGGSSCEVGILRQESISGDDRINIVSFRDVYDLVSVVLLAQ